MIKLNLIDNNNNTPLREENKKWHQTIAEATT
jgi:hypothetical protein